MKKIVYSGTPFSGLEILSCYGDYSFPKHLHDGYVLWLNSQSGEKFSYSGSSDILQPGCLSLIEPGVIHENSPCDPRKNHLRSFYFTEEFLETIMSRFDGIKSFSIPLGTMMIKDTDLWKKLHKLHFSLFLSDNDLFSDVMIIELFASLLERHCEEVRITHNSLQGTDHRLKSVLEFLHENISKKIRLSDLAEVAQCTSYHLIRLFRERMGISPYDYLVQIRLELARNLLNTNQAITDAALLSGFSDQSHLTRKFKIRYGVTPAVYKKQKCPDRFWKKSL